MTHHALWMDKYQPPLHPCSLETIPEPIELPLSKDDDGCGRFAWPMMLSCYQLDGPLNQRVGHMELALISVPDIVNNQNSLPLHFPKEPHIVLDQSTSSGILDGKWKSIECSSFDAGKKYWCFASAHSTGEIKMHTMMVNNNQEERFDSEPLYTLESSVVQAEAPTPIDKDVPPICLSVSWDNPAAWRCKNNSLDKDMVRLLSTYSNGRIAIHDVVFGKTVDSSINAVIIERDSWQAHNLFKQPAEVWSACFASTTTNGPCDVVWSGGDEGKLKAWDLRALIRPTQILEPFDAGVTCVSPHPFREYIVAVGSYDETLCLFDVRYMNRRNMLHRSGKLGGGIWRIKWHPYTENRVLVAAMHGGCRVMNFGGGCFESLRNQVSMSFDGLTSNDLSGLSKATSYDEETISEVIMSSRTTKKFTEHDSMAYGADWMVCQHPTQNGYFEAAASCSFYDRAVYLWDTVFGDFK